MKNEEELYESLKDVVKDNNWIGTITIVARSAKCVWKDRKGNFIPLLIGYGVNIYANRYLKKIEKCYLRLAFWEEELINDLEKCRIGDQIRVEGSLRDLSKEIMHEGQEYRKEIMVEKIEIRKIAGTQVAEVMTEGEMRDLWQGVFTKEHNAVVEKSATCARRNNRA